MTASLGVEISPGRFRALPAVVRPLLRDDAGVAAADDLGTLADRLQRRHRGSRSASASSTARVGWPDRGAERAGAITAGARRGGRAGAGDGPALGLARTSNWWRCSTAASRVDRTLARLRRTRRRATGPAARPGRRGRLAARPGGQRRRASASTTSPGWRRGPTTRWPGSTATRRAPVLRLSPIDVGPRPGRAALWGEVTAVLTSATIPPRSAERLGLDRGGAVDELDVGSPFDYRSHALLYVARHLPDRRTPEAEPALHDELEAADRRRRRPHAGPVHQPAGHRAAAERPRPAARPTGCSSKGSSRRPAARGVRCATRRPACSPPSASGRAWTSRAGPCRS